MIGMKLRQWGVVVFAWLPAICWYGMIFWLSSQPRLPGPEALWAQFVVFKTGHMVVYSTLTLFLLLASLLTWPRRALRDHFQFVWLSVLALAMADEFHQWFVPGRGPHLRDVGIDMLAATGLLWVVSRYNARRLFWQRRIKTLISRIVYFGM